MNLDLLGLMFNFVGGLILFILAIIEPSHQRIFGEKQWWKRYWWEGWMPFWKDTQTHRLRVKLNHVVVRYGFIPPMYQWNIIGFLFLLIGFILQLRAYIF